MLLRLAFLLLLAFAAPAAAAPITYAITVDTTAVFGTPGSIEFQLNPGGSGAVPATGTITAFTGGTLVGSPSYFGNASGTLTPGPATLDNGTPLNALLHDFNYGSGFSFLLTVSGPALDTPDPNNPVGTRFSLFLWDDRAGGGFPIFPIDPFTDPALTIDINPDGTITITHSPPVTVTLFNATAIPEPATWLTFAVCLAACGLAARRARLRMSGVSG